MRIMAVSLILSPVRPPKYQLSTHHLFTTVSTSTSSVVYILTTNDTCSSSIMGLLDKLKGRKKGDSSQAGNPCLHFYLTFAPFLWSRHAYSEVLTVGHSKLSAIAVYLPATGAVYHQHIDRHRLNWHVICRAVDLRFKVLKGLLRPYCERW